MKVSGKAAIIMTIPFLVVTVMARNHDQGNFGPTEEVRTQAELADAALLSPGAYLQGNKYLDQARRDSAAGRNLKRIQKQLAKASENFHAALKNSELAKQQFEQGITSRMAAQEAEAARLVASDWLIAEKTFNAATLALERGNLKNAREKHDEANTHFRTAELNAIRTRLLAEVWQLIAEIQQKEIAVFAPQTLGLAKQLAKRANDLIVADRYTLDEALALADRAVYEARHALFIATFASRIEKEELTLETLILNWESSLGNIATAADIKADFSAGPNATSNEIIVLLEALPALRSDLKDRDALIVGLEDEIRELDIALGGASADRSKLIRRLEQQARVREQFHQVENMFSSNEATVLRDGNKLLIRLSGLRFEPNSTELGADAMELLTKLQTAINIFPQCVLTVEGHTDSQGNTRKNLMLSEQRAQAVKTYMTDVMYLPGFRIKASGYGDTRPIANNKTADGRASNRRIDLIITPNPESM
ncbi:MAG: OmpA family protein [Gammaproteobacteria bacterium]|jgi:outer membrane protein OmpA-like peptidoglycan-associated protein|nr:OmpA family protein [Gammaproteobacteria bacterium]MDP7661297.1 OmpA family protein [Gammaproteobacteria bacterium]